MKASSNYSAIKNLTIASLLSISSLSLIAEENSFPDLVNDKAPTSVQEMWAGFDPKKEPLDTEILKEWEKGGVVYKVVRYRVGIFKGEKSMIAAVYGYPKGVKNLPALVNIHGGGQFADANAITQNAKRGYATISIAWAGRISSPEYTVKRDQVPLYWEGKTDEPSYIITTDWGAVDAYHAPVKNKGNNFAHVKPTPWRIDAVESARNSSWFLCATAARRAITFLEQQKEVDGSKIGVYGHSMGGKITVLTTAADDRVVASAPSCGGVSDRDSKSPSYLAGIADDASLKEISCPIIFLSPSNDFHGRIDDLPASVSEIKSDEFRITASPHHNHQDTAPYEVASLLWFDQYLKGTFTYPKTPQTEISLNGLSGSPTIKVTADHSKPIDRVEVYYTQDGISDDVAKFRFWHTPETKKSGDAWTAQLDLESLNKPLWVYANVFYKLDQSVNGAGYYYRTFETAEYSVSSVPILLSKRELNETGLITTIKPSLEIENFKEGWQKNWFSYVDNSWSWRTNKLHNQTWKAPEGAELSLTLKSKEENQLVVRIDDYATTLTLPADTEKTHTMKMSDFKDSLGKALESWQDIKQLELAPQLSIKKQDPDTKKKKSLPMGQKWNGKEPHFINLSWIK